ncbi:MAG: hypothetical protein NC921_01545 [Candidatus Omnitrophica bacterium]|nr:hypothetical protein [Candidatus Omnitrophota bacterium]
MKRYYIILTEIILLLFILAGCECGPGIPGEPIEGPEPELPPPTTPPSPPPQTQNEYFKIEGNNLVYFDGTKKYYLIKDKVENLKFDKVKGYGNSYYVNVDLNLKDGKIRTFLNSVIALRNISRTINSVSTDSGSSSGSGSSSDGSGSSGAETNIDFQPVKPPEIGPPFPPPGSEEAK